MNSHRRRFAVVLAASILPLLASAQTVVTGPVQPTAVAAVAAVGVPQHAEITLTLGHYDGIFFIRQPDPPPPLTVLPGSSLKLVTGYDNKDVTSVDWFKNDTKIAAGVSALELTSVKAEDSGVYIAVVHRASGDLYTNPGTIRVCAAPKVPLLNLSSRATLSPANPTLIAGFVVAPSPGQLKESKYLLLRAVGPSLIHYGVKQPLARPVLRVFDSAGREIELPTMHIPEIPGPEGLAKLVAPGVGAFPLDEGSADVAGVWSFAPGAYTVHVGAADGGSGDVMLEIYEVSDELVRAFSTWPMQVPTPVVVGAVPVTPPPVVPTIPGD